LAVYNSTQGNGCFPWWLTLKKNGTFPLRLSGWWLDFGTKGHFGPPRNLTEIRLDKSSLLPQHQAIQAKCHTNP